MPPPRLLQRTRRPDAASSGRQAPDDAPLELPPYEPPSYPMDEAIKRKLAAISGSRETDSARRQYETHLAKSSTYLFESVGSINDILFARKRSLAHMVEKRWARGEDGTSDAQLSLEEYVAELDATITELTDSSEQALRWVIDCRAELEDHQAVLEQVMEGLNAQRPPPEPRPPKIKRRAADSDDEDGGPDSGDGEAQEEEDEAGEMAAEDVPPLVGAKELLEAARKAKMSEYDALSAHQRYAVNNDYISFKKNWHDALHPEDQVPLPDPSTWFDEHGRPTKDAVADANGDDDLVVEREIIDLKCPLSLQIMKEPYSNQKCRHTFEKLAIMEFIQSNGGMAKCPVCSEDLRIKDLYLDEVVLRKVKRAAEAARRGVDDTSDIEAEDDDSSMIVGKSINIKKERARSQRRMEEIDADDD
ncbi:zinc-finger of the MIZ type in Nse subunit-domain-containing protein [Chaetomium fimeti]|uniref:peptidylprolyl isomerase n=1 Tax=Chaetomium fimeti TaxID=1854472 RepID=A0AAE0HAM4_9PEZI|nr:zinc-finger of the MIZ type in Nse subunit-domain-containing protein [Chaetomium fimeti]